MPAPTVEVPGRSAHGSRVDHGQAIEQVLATRGSRYSLVRVRPRKMVGIAAANTPYAGVGLIAVAVIVVVVLVAFWIRMWS